MKTLVAVFLSVFAAAIFLAACKTSRKGSESAPNRVISRDGNFELRDYPSLTIVETSMDGDSGTSFQRLFRYISGANSDGEKIPMTTPVFMAGEEPSRSMSFVMPANMKSAPGPKDSALRVTTLPAGRFAVFGFSGSRSAEAESEKCQSHTLTYFWKIAPIFIPDRIYFCENKNCRTLSGIVKGVCVKNILNRVFQ